MILGIKVLSLNEKGGMGEREGDGLAKTKDV